MIDHVMLDLETLGTGNRAVILSIGAVKFRPDTPAHPNLFPVYDSFHIGVDPRSCVAHGLEMDADTVMWWFDSGRDHARQALQDLERVDLVTALEGFAMWFGAESLPTWGNGAVFDNVIMRSAYKATGQETPWKFWDDRCYRTLKALAPDVVLERVGTYHNALDDARSQAKHLQTIVAKLGISV